MGKEKQSQVGLSCFSSLLLDLQNVLHTYIFKKRLFFGISTWGKVFKNGPSKICGSKGCLPQILLHPFLNALPHILLSKKPPKISRELTSLIIW